MSLCDWNFILVIAPFFSCAIRLYYYLSASIGEKVRSSGADRANSRRWRHDALIFSGDEREIQGAHHRPCAYRVSPLV